MDTYARNARKEVRLFCRLPNMQTLGKSYFRKQLSARNLFKRVTNLREQEEGTCFQAKTGFARNFHLSPNITDHMELHLLQLFLVDSLAMRAWPLLKVLMETLGPNRVSLTCQLGSTNIAF